MKCWHNHCNSKLEFTCPCANPPVYSCGLHIVEHLRDESLQGHHPENLFTKPKPETKKALIEQLAKLSSDLSTVRENLIKQVSEKVNALVSQMKKSLEEIDRMKEEQQNLIQKINSTSEISKENRSFIEELLSLSPEEAVKMLKDLKFTIEDVKLDKTPECSPTKIEEKVETRTISRESFEMEVDEIVVFRNSTKKIARVNLATFNTTEVEVEVADPIFYYVAMCEIPNTGVFCFGNWNPCRGTAYIIYPDSRIKQLEDGAPCCYSGAVYYKKAVYVFGGCSGNYLTLAEKYNFTTEKWEKLSPMPDASHLVTTLVYNCQILLSGYHHSKLYSYDINYDTYLEVLDLKPDVCRMLCKGNDKAYLIEWTGQIYECEYNISSWRVVGEALPSMGCPIGYGSIYKGFSYFVDHTFTLYQFDLGQLKINKSKQV
ncbi:unnamed protein product [Blepharisma stoltei]|uniref:Uncharacterized protein n=1 Tax=Blepharisma stoltei TaxID=1481888 RepID=A0AAU9KC57_9CILI|nr:unnamed protein product [Blepharisma stoltei]